MQIEPTIQRQVVHSDAQFIYILLFIFKTSGSLNTVLVYKKKASDIRDRRSHCLFAHSIPLTFSLTRARVSIDHRSVTRSAGLSQAEELIRKQFSRTPAPLPPAPLPPSLPQVIEGGRGGSDHLLRDVSRVKPVQHRSVHDYRVADTQVTDSDF